MFPDVEGSSENVDEEVLFCLKLENGKYVNVIYCELKNDDVKHTLRHQGKNITCADAMMMWGPPGC